jgi:hypothetical protein
MGVKTESFHSGEFLLSEAPGALSREEITVKSGEDLAAGQVLRLDSDKYVAYDDASQEAVGILLDAVDATEGDKKGVIIERLAEVKAAALDWSTSDSSAKTAGIADLLARNIKVR